MIADYLAAKIAGNMEDIDALAVAEDSSVASAAFHYYEATCDDKEKKQKPANFRSKWQPHLG